MRLDKIKNGLSSSLVRNTLKLSTSNAILYLLPLIITPILSRLYSPDYFGGWGIFASTFSIISVILLGSYDNAIIKAPEQDIKPLCQLCLTLGIISSLLTFAVFYIGSSAHWAFFSTFPSYRLLTIILFIQIFILIYTNLLNKSQHYNILSISNLINGCSQGAFRISWKFITNVGNGLIIGTVLANAVNLIYLIIKSKPLNVFKAPFKEVLRIAKKYRNFPMYDAPALLLQFAALNLPIIILSFYFSRSDIGCYSLIVQLLVLPVSFIGSAMGKVYYQQISTEGSVDEQIIQKSTFQVLKILVYLSVIPSLFICLGGNKVITWFLGSKWHLAGDMSICMAIWSIPTILTESLKSLFRVRDKQKYLLYIEITYFITGIGFLLLGCYKGWLITQIIFIYSIICCAVRFFVLIKILSLSDILFSMLPKGSIILVSLTILITITRSICIIC